MFVYDIVAFLVILTIVVFVHEFGHYWVARRAGVRVEVFSIGFGRELFGWTDRAGTRWKFSMFPLGGYVRMFGDRNEASAPDAAGAAAMSAEDRKVSFPHKRLDQRAAVVAAGPIANFIFGILIFAAIFASVGEPYTAPVLGAVEPDSAAAEAGLQPGDRILGAGGQSIDRFEDLQRVIQVGLGEPVSLTIERDGRELVLPIVPRVVVETDDQGREYQVGRLGVRAAETRSYERHDPATAVWRGAVASWTQVETTFKALGQIIAGDRTAKEIGGPLRIASISADMASAGWLPTLFWLAILSINLGLINLFPVPMLDGGHLAYYAAEAVRGRPLGQRTQEYGFRIGLALILILFVFATWNDLGQFRVVQFLKGLIT